MATDPSFAATVNNGAAALSGVDAAPPVGTSASVIITAGASGSKVEEVVVENTGTTVASLIYVWLYDGTNYRLFDTLILTANTASTTNPPLRVNKTYANLFMKTGWSLRASMSVAPSTGSTIVHGLGGDF